MNEVIFDKSTSKALAKVSTETNVIFFPTDGDAIIMGGKEYGGTVAATQAAQQAATSANAAAASADDAAQYISDLQTSINNLPSAQAVSAQVALMQDHKVELIDIRAITATYPYNTLKDSNGNAIDAGKCQFVYSKEVTGGIRYYLCESVAFNYMSDNYTLVKFKTSNDAPYYTYWVFQGPDTWACLGIYNEDTLPTLYKNVFPSDAIQTKISKITNPTVGDIPKIGPEGILIDSGMDFSDIIPEFLSDAEIEAMWYGWYPYGNSNYYEEQSIVGSM